MALSDDSSKRTDDGFIDRVRLAETYERVEIPEGYRRCQACTGRGMVSEYDLGARSLVHDPEMAAKRPCWLCGGDGYVCDLSAR